MSVRLSSFCTIKSFELHSVPDGIIEAYWSDLFDAKSHVRTLKSIKKLIFGQCFFQVCRCRGYARLFSLRMSCPSSPKVSDAFCLRSRNCTLYSSVWLGGAKRSSMACNSESKSLELCARFPNTPCAWPRNDTAKYNPLSL
ncbi:hypothetical protein DPMN_134160 [Dreissena polymorpha]|uniref:Uncharacterized protein n=1 Tax=Dreissena polymorpha TaxID=45954 RepID=A0A9D4JAG5_DREPO|nr:hypothetical protein DPMN_134160 [Dreissena polymorpha]